MKVMKHNVGYNVFSFEYFAIFADCDCASFSKYISCQWLPIIFLASRAIKNFSRFSQKNLVLKSCFKKFQLVMHKRGSVEMSTQIAPGLDFQLFKPV